jgi:hypothetical protein
MKTYGGVDMQVHVLLTSAVAGGEWSASHPGVRAYRCGQPYWRIFMQIFVVNISKAYSVFIVNGLSSTVSKLNLTKINVCLMWF